MKAKNIVIYVVVALLLVGGTFLITKNIYDKKTDNKQDTNNTVQLNPGEISELKEYTGDIPEFNIPVRGLYDGTFNDNVLKTTGIKVYEFSGNVKYSWGYVQQDYVGIKFSDVLDYYKITDFETLELNDYNGATIRFNKNQITDKSFIILKRNGKVMVEPFAGFIDFNYLYNYSMEDVLSMTFK